ncbi:hypothetical protein HDU67_000132, partial [Dinochytrium kinnereticum]
MPGQDGAGGGDPARRAVWAAIMVQVDVDRDLASIACVCRASSEASKDVAGVLAPRLIRMHGKFQAIYTLYRTAPHKLTLDMLQALMDQDARLPRYLVLCLSREKETQMELKKDLIAHLEYRKQLQDQIELRAKVLEEQRLEGARRLKRAKESMKAVDRQKVSEDGDPPTPSSPMSPDGQLGPESAADAAVTSPDSGIATTETAMMPLPVFPELKPVPPPAPIPATPSSFLPPGMRDAIISAGIEMYGRVFPPYPPPPVSPQDRLPQNLQWVGRLPETPSNPCYTWPPDDAAFFSFLIKNAAGAATLAKPKESWGRICGGIRELILRYGFMPTLFLGPTADALAPWRTPGLDMFSPLTGTPSSSSAAASVSITATYPWLPSEMFRYDRPLALFLGRAAGIGESQLNDEIVFWDLINSNIHIPPSRYSPSPQSAEALIIKSLSHLRKPPPSTSIRRLILNHPSKALVTRLLNFISRPQLETIGEGVLASLLGEPSNYGGVALNSADGVIAAFGFGEDVVGRCFLANDLDVSGDATPITSDAFEEVEDVMESYWAEDASTKDDGAPDDEVDAAVESKPTGPHRHMMTRQGRLTGTIQWTHWKWAVAKFGRTHVAAKACLHDLALRESIEDPNAERRWQFADKEANAAVRSLIDEGVEPAPITVRRMAARILRDAKRREEGWEFGYGLDGSVVAPRFIMIMAKVERLVLELAGSRVKKETTPQPPQESTTVVLDEQKPEASSRVAESVTSEPPQMTTDFPASPIPPPDSPNSERAYRPSPTITSSDLKSLAASLSTAAKESPTKRTSLTNLRASPVPIPEPTEEPDRTPSPLLTSWLNLLRACVVDNEAWKLVVTSYADALGVPLGGYHGGDPPEVRFYWATVAIVRDAGDLTVEPGWVFGEWEEGVCDKLGIGRRVSAPVAAVAVPVVAVPQESGGGGGSTLGKRGSAWELAWA